MDVPFYTVCKADPTVQALLGGTSPRIYPFSEAPQDVAKPYVVYQDGIGGFPFNMLNCRPDADSFDLQVDVYGLTQDSVKAVTKAIRHAIELQCNINSYRGSDRETDTKLWRMGFDLTWLVNRS